MPPSPDDNWRKGVEVLVAFASDKVTPEDLAKLASLMEALIAAGLGRVLHPTWHGPGFAVRDVYE